MTATYERELSRIRKTSLAYSRHGSGFNLDELRQLANNR